MLSRLERITAILLLLQSRRTITAQQLAKKFNTSIRTIYRDIRVLEEAGLPIGAEAGLGYYLLEGYSLPPVMFSKEEAAALLTGEKLLHQFGDVSINEEYTAAMNKIRSVLRNTEKYYLETLEQNIEVYRSGHRKPDADFPNRFISLIQKALVHQQVIEMEYFSSYKEEYNTRLVEPIGLCYMSGGWHLFAWCRLRKDIRDFRTDRIKSLRLKDEQYKKSKLPTLSECMKQWSNADSLHRIVLLLDNQLAKQAGEMKYYLGLIEETKQANHTRMVFLHSSLEQFAVWLPAWGNQVEIVEPKELKVVMKKLVKTLHQHYA